MASYILIFQPIYKILNKEHNRSYKRVIKFIQIQDQYETH